MRRSFLLPLLAVAATAVSGQNGDSAHELTVACEGRDVTLTMQNDQISDSCANPNGKTMVKDFQVNVGALRSLKLNIQSGNVIGTLNFTAVNGTPVLEFDSDTLDLSKLTNLYSLRFDGVAFESETVKLKLYDASDIHFVDMAMGNLSLETYPTSLTEIDLDNTSFTHIPAVLWERDYNDNMSIIVDLALVENSTTLSNDSFVLLVNNLGVDVLNTCKNYSTAEGSKALNCSPDTKSDRSNDGSISNPNSVESRHSSSGSEGSTDAGDGGGISTGALIAIIVVVVVIAAVLAFFILRMHFRRKAANANAQNEATATLMSKGDAVGEKGSFISNDEFLRNYRLPQSDVSLVKSVGTGRLWMGEYNSDKVIVKRVESEVTDSFVTKALMAQARSFATISHPNITNLVGVTWLAGTDFAVVTEFMGKGNLKTVLSNTDVDLDVSTKVQMCLDVALALAYLHETEQNMCAKKLSSRKVLVNSALSCKLSLFECVPSSTKLGGPSTATTYSYGMGEVAWLAPEVITRSSPMDARKNNMYAFGVLVSEIFTRVSPYQALIEKQGNTMSDVELVKRVRRQEPLVPHENRPAFLEAPVSVQQLVEQCLLYAPMSRPTAKDLVNVLHRAKEDLATTTI